MRPHKTTKNNIAFMAFSIHYLKSSTVLNHVFRINCIRYKKGFLLKRGSPACKDVRLIRGVGVFGCTVLTFQVSLRSRSEILDLIEQIGWDKQIANESAWTPLVNMHLFMASRFSVKLAAWGYEDCRHRENAHHSPHSGNVPYSFVVNSHIWITDDI